MHTFSYNPKLFVMLRGKIGPNIARADFIASNVYLRLN